MNSRSLIQQQQWTFQNVFVAPQKTVMKQHDETVNSQAFLSNLYMNDMLTQWNREGCIWYNWQEVKYIMDTVHVQVQIH